MVYNTCNFCLTSDGTCDAFKAKYAENGTHVQPANRSFVALEYFCALGKEFVDDNGTAESVWKNCSWGKQWETPDPLPTCKCNICF